MPHPQNPDRVTPPTALGALAGLAIAALAKTYLDVEVDPADGTLWWEVTTAVIFPALAGIGAALAARFKARNDVTPVTPGDQPRDQDGNDLVSVVPGGPTTHKPSTGYPRPRSTDLPGAP
jgi:hypothetical protein